MPGTCVASTLLLFCFFLGAILLLFWCIYSVALVCFYYKFRAFQEQICWDVWIIPKLYIASIVYLLTFLLAYYCCWIWWFWPVLLLYKHIRTWYLIYEGVYNLWNYTTKFMNYLDRKLFESTKIMEILWRIVT